MRSVRVRVLRAAANRTRFSDVPR
jgi:hypothetical protein